eukprot:4584786-Pleurochrysis_carterae.AAC.3
MHWSLSWTRACAPAADPAPLSPSATSQMPTALAFARCETFAKTTTLRKRSFPVVCPNRQHNRCPKTPHTKQRLSRRNATQDSRHLTQQVYYRADSDIVCRVGEPDQHDGHEVVNVPGRTSEKQRGAIFSGLFEEERSEASVHACRRERLHSREARARVRACAS